MPPPCHTPQWRCINKFHDLSEREPELDSGPSWIQGRAGAVSKGLVRTPSLDPCCLSNAELCKQPPQAAPEPSTTTADCCCGPRLRKRQPVKASFTFKNRLIANYKGEKWMRGKLLLTNPCADSKLHVPVPFLGHRSSQTYPTSAFTPCSQSCRAAGVSNLKPSGFRSKNKASRLHLHGAPAT